MDEEGGRDIDRGWAWVVMTMTYLGLMMFSTSFCTVGVVYVVLLDRYHDDEVKTSLVGTLNTALYCLLAPFASAFISRYTCRTSIIIGGLIMATSGILSSCVDSVGMLILTHGVLGGIGNTLVGIPLGVILGFYFQKRRHFLISLSGAVFGAGMFLSTPLALAIFTEYGMQGGFLILGGFNLHMCIIGMICKPSSLEIHIKQRKHAEKHSFVSIDTLNDIKQGVMKYFRKLNDLFHFELLTNVQFILFLVSGFTWNFMLSMCQLHLPNYMLRKGSGPGEITLIMTLFGVSNTVGRFLGAFSTNNSQIDILLVHVILLAISGLSVITFPVYGNLAGADYFFAVVNGLSTGVPNGFMTSIALSIVGLNSLVAAHGVQYFFCGLGYGGGPPVASALYSQSESYETSFIFGGCTVIIGSILALLAYINRKKTNNAKLSGSTELQINTNRQHTNGVSKRNGSIDKQTGFTDSLLNHSGFVTADGVLSPNPLLQNGVDDILLLAGSTRSITI